MLETLLDFGLSIFSGGATGLLGTAITAAVDYFQGRAEHKREIDLRRLDIELARAEAEGAAHVAAIEAEGRREEAEWDAMAASYREAGKRWSRPGDGVPIQLVDFVRGMTRPALTFGLVALVGAIYFLLGADDDMLAYELRPRIVDTVLYLGTAAVLWWFGSRQIEKRRIAGTPWRK